MQVHNWPIGPLLAQSAHAATAVLHLHSTHPDVRRYLEGDDGRGWEVMRKVTYEVADGEKLDMLAKKLREAGMGYHLWVEQPCVPHLYLESTRTSVARTHLLSLAIL